MTLAETGAYINLLAAAWQADDCGLPSDDASLAKLSEAGADWPTVKGAVLKCFCLENGRFFNEKQKAELKYFTKQQANGKRGGRPTETQPITQTETQDLSQKKPCHKPEARSQKLEIRDPDPPPLPPNGGSASEAFDRFWKAYPKKIGKGAARDSWRKRKLDSKCDEILAAVLRCKNLSDWNREAGRFIPHPATWLNQSRWEDEPESKPNGRLKVISPFGEEFSAG